MTLRRVKPLWPSLRCPHWWQELQGRVSRYKEQISRPSLIFVLWLKKNIWDLHFKIWWSKTIMAPSVCLTTNELDYKPSWAPVSYSLVALTVFEVSCGNFITHILSRISGACWKLLMTDVSPLCHTPCIIWFGKQHTVFWSISMSQTVCKQLVITQFSENHYFPMKCWRQSKLCFGMASAP